MLQSHLLYDTVQLASSDHLLILNSAADPFVARATQHISTGIITLAEDNIATAELLLRTSLSGIRHVAFHDYILHDPPATMDIAVMNLLYQPGNTWLHHGLQVAAYALRSGGRLYVVGAKDRGILSMAKRMREYFGNVETLTISKGYRVLCSHKLAGMTTAATSQGVTIFAESNLDDGTRLLLDVLEIQETDKALDLGCGAGFIGLHIARFASKGHVTMVDVSLAAVAMARQAVEQSGLANICVLPGDGAQAVLSQRFDLVVTNPPFHQGGMQTMEIAERFIHEAAQVLHPQGRFYLVANRFLKYEPTLRACFKKVEEVGGDARYKVLLAI